MYGLSLSNQSSRIDDMGNRISSSQYNAMQLETTRHNHSNQVFRYHHPHHHDVTNSTSNTQIEQELETNHTYLMLEPSDFAVPELLNEIYINFDRDVLLTGQDIIDLMNVPENTSTEDIEGKTLLVNVDPNMFFVRGFIYPHPSSATWSTWTYPDTPLWKLRQAKSDINVKTDKIQSTVQMSDVFQHHNDKFLWIPSRSQYMYGKSIDVWRQYWIKQVYNNVITIKRDYDMQGQRQNENMFAMWIPAYQVLNQKVLQSSIQAHQAKINTLKHQLLKYSLKE
jgi:hypothetical protein